MGVTMTGPQAALLITLCASVLAACSPSEMTPDRTSEDPIERVSPTPTGSGRSNPPEEDVAAVPENPAPEFAFETFEGDTFRLSAQGGRPLVLNFWESW